MQMNNWNVTKTIAVVILLVVSFAANAQTSNSILGKWKDAEHHKKQIEITDQNGKFVGKGINSPKPAENGKTILKDLVWSNASKSYKGILINPDNGDEYKVEIKMIGIDKFRFSVGKFIFSKTFNFNRLNK
ncbi:MAG: DUF2147 domain-containing protein [Cytophagales bacterium]|nr:MAG: DUF2147 domain-containing protein [Cytophagales bacterium]